MSKHTFAFNANSIIRLPLLLALLAQVGHGMYLDFNRFSVFIGADVEFDGYLEDEGDVEMAWYRDKSILSVDHLDQEFSYCWQNWTNLVLVESDERISADCELGARECSFIINNVTESDTGVYCLLGLIEPNDVETAVKVASYLKVTVDDHEKLSLMIILLSVAAVWFIVLSIGLGIVTGTDYLKQKKQDKINNEKSRKIQEAADAITNAVPQSPVVSTGSNAPLFKSTASLNTVHYMATAATQRPLAETVPELSISAPELTTATPSSLLAGIIEQIEGNDEDDGTVEFF